MSDSLFPGRLGLAGSRMPHTDRHGLLWLSRGNLYVEDGCLRFLAAGTEEIKAGEYSIPYQSVSMILLGPGTTVTHDVLRLLARHGTLLAAVGEGGVKFYTAPPLGRGSSQVAREHARLWADEGKRVEIARLMYSYRFGEEAPEGDLERLRGIEGSRLKESYRILARKYGVNWKGRRYDRQKPDAADVPNQAINHAAVFVEAAADVAVASVGALPPLGFVHEEAGKAFVLDIADLWRVDTTIPLAFSVAAKVTSGEVHGPLEKSLRYEAAHWFKKRKLIPAMIDCIKEILGVDDGGSNT